jgi:hypothetical protein
VGDPSSTAPQIQSISVAAGDNGLNYDFVNMLAGS